jgi:hypothetical protein
LRAGLNRYSEHFDDPWFDEVTMRMTEIAMQRMFPGH